MKRTIPQSVFDSAEARGVQRAAIAESNRDQDAKFAAGGPFDEGNPNHPMYDSLFGYERDEFMAKQYRKSA
jgi:hypothetical protein